MTKNEAICAMRNGKRMTHKWFTEEEWATIEGDTIVFENGCQCSFDEFWRLRSDDSWLNDWSEYLKERNNG
jgi:hypothetical protein